MRNALFPALEEGLAATPHQVNRWKIPKRIRKSIPIDSAIGENFKFVPAIVSGSFEGAELSRQVGNALPRQNAVTPASRRLAVNRQRDVTYCIQNANHGDQACQLRGKLLAKEKS